MVKKFLVEIEVDNEKVNIDETKISEMIGFYLEEFGIDTEDEKEDEKFEYSLHVMEIQ